jgi:hypothetical protein
MTELLDKFHEAYTPLPETGCWLWDACGGKTRYGTLYDSSSKKMIRATRFIYEQAHGKIPDGMVVRHKCDVSLCVNPDHLEIGTQADNVRDTVDRGRVDCRKGEENGRSKLTEDDVKYIRSVLKKSDPSKPKSRWVGADPKELAEKYGVRRETIYDVAKGSKWPHIEYDPD